MEQTVEQTLEQQLAAAVPIYIRSHVGGGFHRLSEFSYFTAELKYVTATTLGGSEYVLDGSLKSLEERYGSLLVRVHRKCLVPAYLLSALESYENPETAPRDFTWGSTVYYAVVDTSRVPQWDGESRMLTRVPVSRRHVSVVRQHLRRQDVMSRISK